MNNLANNLTANEAYYRDYFQGMWNLADHRAGELLASYDKLRPNSNALNTRAAESIARGKRGQTTISALEGYA